MSIRPLCDYWILAKSKHGYFGGYPAGFLERARVLLTAGGHKAAIWHIPGGMAHHYNGAGGMPLKGFGPEDVRIDLSPYCQPDILMDVRRLPELVVDRHRVYAPQDSGININNSYGLPRPDAVLIDRPYTQEYQQEYCNRYGLQENAFPEDLNQLVREALRIVRPGGNVGVLDFKIPSPGKDIQCQARVAVDCGNNMQIRSFTVWRYIT